MWACPSTNKFLFNLGDEVDDSHSESVNSAIEPPIHHLVDRAAHLRVLPIEVGLALLNSIVSGELENILSSSAILTDDACHSRPRQNRVFQSCGAASNSCFV